MLKIRNSYTLCVAVVFALVSPLVNAQTPTNNNNTQSLTIPHSTKQAVIDGELDDAIWSEANTINLNIVNDPWNNEKSPVETTAKVIENGEFLYISFIAQDPNPNNIQASLGDRDTKWGDDLVAVKLDTFNTRRLNYQFMVNPFGVQIDAIYNEKDIKKAASVCSPKLARLLLHYKTSQSVAKHMFNMPFEKVTSIKPEDSGVKVRERYEDMATITVYIEGFFYGDHKKDVKRLSLIQNEKNHWVINEILKDPF